MANISPSPQLSADSTLSTPADSGTQSAGSELTEDQPRVIIKTVTEEPVASASSDVAVQATPSAVAAELSLNQPGILPVTQAMRSVADQTMITSVATNKNINQDNMTNTKEKTPMCLINELSRFNKIPHRYMLTDEKGPAHKKQFHVKLELGEESYSAWGGSIKRAQHAAAEEALKCTVYKKAVNRPVKTKHLIKKPVMTPTVELNAFAMKLSQTAEYSTVYLRPLTMQPLPPPIHYMYPPAYPQGYLPPPPQAPLFRPKIARMYGVSLKVGHREFRGEGTTRQQARHHAAGKALKVLKALNLQPLKIESPPPTASEKNINEQETSSNGINQLGGGDTSKDSQGATDDDDVDDCNGAMAKSEISEVHELALRHNLGIAFEVTHESGPPHLRTFITCCKCGDFMTQGEGNSKKTSKKLAALSMLEKLSSLPLPASVNNKITKPKTVVNKKKNRNLIKMQKANPDYGSGINPVSRLIQIQQAKKKKEPVYTLVDEQGLPRRREFIIQVSCNDKVCHGCGPNKKLAKRNAAEAMLLELGYSKPSPSPGKSVLKGETNSATTPSKHVTFNVDLGQRVPGILLMKTEHHQTSSNVATPPAALQQTEKTPVKVEAEEVKPPHFDTDLAASIASQLLQSGKSLSAQTVAPSGVDHPADALLRPVDQLQYLAKCMDFLLEYTDFPKGANTNMFLTLVALQTNPAQVFHGSAPTIEQSQDEVSLQALQGLSKAATKCEENGGTPLKPTSVDESGDQLEVKPSMNKSAVVELKSVTSGVEISSTGLTASSPSTVTTQISTDTSVVSADIAVTASSADASIVTSDQNSTNSPTS